MKYSKSLTRVAMLLLIIVAMIQFTGCTITPDAGCEAVKVKKPWTFFGTDGVVDKPVTTGLAFRCPSTSAKYFDMRPIRYTEVFDDLVTSDNNTVDFRSYITIDLEDGTSPETLTDHGEFWDPKKKSNGKDWYHRRIKEVFRSHNRQYARGHSLNQVISDTLVINNAQENMKKKMQKHIDDIGLKATVVEVLIGKATPDEEVLSQSKATAIQKQREDTWKAIKDTEKARKNAEKERALADKEYFTEFGKGMTINQFLTMRSLQIRERELDILEKRRDIKVIWGAGGASVQPIAPMSWSQSVKSDNTSFVEELENLASSVVSN